MKGKLTKRQKKVMLDALEQEELTLLGKLNRLLGMRQSVMGELMNYDRRMLQGVQEIECLNGLEPKECD